MKLFTRSDLERCARAAILAHVRSGSSELEAGVDEAVRLVADDGPLYYDEWTVKEVLRSALGKEDVDAELAEGLRIAGLERSM